MKIINNSSECAYKNWHATNKKEQPICGHEKGEWCTKGNQFPKNCPLKKGISIPKTIPEDQINYYIVNLLSNLAAFNLLNKQIVDQISQSFHIDCILLCKENGITYFI